MSEKRSFAVTLIGDINILYAALWIIATCLNMANKSGAIEAPLLDYVGNGLGLVLSAAFLTAAIGYLGLKRWGYWLLLVFNICLLAMAIISFRQGQQQSSYIGIVWGVASLSFIVPTRVYFDKG